MAVRSAVVESQPFHQNGQTLSKTTHNLITVYEAAENRQTRLQILSLFVNEYSKSQLSKLIPGLSYRQINDARKHVKQFGAGIPVEKKEVHRIRLDINKTDHFLDFISNPALLQDVAFGTKTLKLDSGESIVIPAAIRTLIPTRIIKQYIDYCKAVKFEKPLNERTLYRILSVCAASKQKSLQGLDYFATEGADAFKKLETIINILANNGASAKWAKTAKQGLTAAKRYLKTDFKAHVTTNEKSVDHCILYALSDPTRLEFGEQCGHSHEFECQKYMRLDKLMEDISDKVKETSLNEENMKRVTFQVSQSRESIHSWKSHLVRAVNQENAKQDALASLDERTALITMDWAMKFLPKKFREQMKDFFGKRGLSWHVSAVTKRRAGELVVECFVHLFNNCTQNWFSVASIVEHTLATIKKEDPSIVKFC